MTDKTALGDRMKAHEQSTKIVLPRRTYAVIRSDGKAFHSYLKDAERPYDDNVMALMNATAVQLCEQIQGAVFAFTQSDEISVLVTDFDSIGSQPWLGGGVQKIASISASIATATFNALAAEYRETRGFAPRGMALFDARVFTISDPVEVANYMLWRQRDCVRNSISMAAQAKFSHKQLHGKSSGDMQEMLWADHGINWNDYEPGCKRGRVVVRHTEEQDVTYTDRRSGEETTTRAIRSRWEAEGAPHFTAEPGGWLAGVIPPLPTLTDRRTLDE